MNRRSFIEAAIKAAAGFAILPGAATYARRWVAAREPVTYYRRENLWVPMPPAEWSEGAIIGWPGLIDTSFFTPFWRDYLNSVEGNLK